VEPAAFAGARLRKDGCRSESSPKTLRTPSNAEARAATSDADSTVMAVGLPNNDLGATADRAKIPPSEDVRLGESKVRYPSSRNWNPTPLGQADP
jgi:hypothetical protein